MAPEALAREESELRAQREDGARKALKVRPLQGCENARAPLMAFSTVRSCHRVPELTNSICIQEALEPQKGSALDNKRYEHLEKLLNQTGMYTEFLSEQLQALDEEMAGDPEEAVPGQKRKGGKQGGRAKKKGAAAKTTAGSKKVSMAVGRVPALML